LMQVVSSVVADMGDRENGGSGTIGLRFGRFDPNAAST
jgi:hypothetical protein